MIRTFLAALLALAACTPAAIDPIIPPEDDGKIGAGPDEAVDTSKEGPFAVGVTTFVVNDPNRIDPNTNEPRSLLVEVWYPAEDASRDLPREDYGVEDLLHPEDIDRLGLDPQQEFRIQTNAARDVTPRKDQGPYPLVIFSHGNGGVRMQSVFLTVLLASHGYVVASVDHTGNTLGDLFARGIGIPPTNELLQVATDRPIDASVVIDAMLERNELAGDPLNGTIDPEEIGITGHSFGAFTSMAASAQDKRIKASVPLSPTSSLVLNAIDVLPEDIQVNTMIMGGGRDQTLEFEANAQNAFDALNKGKKALVNIVDAGHFTFSDICAFDLQHVADIAGINTQGVLNDGCSPDNIDPARGHEIINMLTVSFFNAELRDSFPSRVQLHELFQSFDAAEVVNTVDLFYSVAP